MHLNDLRQFKTQISYYYIIGGAAVAVDLPVPEVPAGTRYSYQVVTILIIVIA